MDCLCALRKMYLGWRFLDPLHEEQYRCLLKDWPTQILDAVSQSEKRTRVSAWVNESLEKRFLLTDILKRCIRMSVEAFGSGKYSN